MQISVLPPTCMQQRWPQRLDHDHTAKRQEGFVLTKPGSSLHWQQQPRMSPEVLWGQNKLGGRGVQRCGGLPSRGCPFLPPHISRTHSICSCPGIGSSQEESPAPTMAQGKQSQCCAHPRALTLHKNNGIHSHPAPANRSTSSPFPFLRFSPL